jgi:Zn-dependent M28 family amino/carboxypeptidase
MRKPVLVPIVLACALLSAQCTQAPDQFVGDRAYAHVLKQDEFGPRPVGSEAGRKTAEYIASELEELGWATEMQDFTYRDVPGVNVLASKGNGPLVLLGAHFDTRLFADRDPVDRSQPVPGANDGGSGVAVLLELARVLDLKKAGAEVWLAFFDAEDQGYINGWPFSVGAAEMAERLSARPEAVVIVDMVGDAHQQIYFERNSDEELMRILWSIAAELGYEAHFIAQYRHAIIDDHLPFVKRGIPAVDIIDFDYPYWHTVEDTPDKVRPESLERVGRVLETWLEERFVRGAD